MDLEVFGQSLAVEPTTTRLDQDEENLSAPPSPLISHPQTPINPTSPQELYPVQVLIKNLTLCSYDFTTDDSKFKTFVALG